MRGPTEMLQTWDIKGLNLQRLQHERRQMGEDLEVDNPVHFSELLQSLPSQIQGTEPHVFVEHNFAPSTCTVFSCVNCMLHRIGLPKLGLYISWIPSKNAASREDLTKTLLCSREQRERQSRLWSVGNGNVFKSMLWCFAAVCWNFFLLLYRGVHSLWHPCAAKGRKLYVLPQRNGEVWGSVGHSFAQTKVCQVNSFEAVVSDSSVWWFSNGHWRIGTSCIHGKQSIPPCKPLCLCGLALKAALLIALPQWRWCGGLLHACCTHIHQSESVVPFCPPFVCPETHWCCACKHYSMGALLLESSKGNWWTLDTLALETLQHADTIQKSGGNSPEAGEESPGNTLLQENTCTILYINTENHKIHK